jgi:hypothetical protein
MLSSSSTSTSTSRMSKGCVAALLLIVLSLSVVSTMAWTTASRRKVTVASQTTGSSGRQTSCSSSYITSFVSTSTATNIQLHLHPDQAGELVDSANDLMKQKQALEEELENVSAPDEEDYDDDDDDDRQQDLAVSVVRKDVTTTSVVVDDETEEICVAGVTNNGPVSWAKNKLWPFNKDHKTDDVDDTQLLKA